MGHRANEGAHSPRVWVLAQRGLSSAVARSGSIEFEDLIVSSTNGTLIAPTTGRATAGLRRVQNVAGRRFRTASRIPTGLVVDDPGGECDLLVVVCSHQSDLRVVNALPNWRQRAAKKILWLEELWLDDVDRWPAYTELMSHFDHVFVGFEQASSAVAELTGTPTSYLPFGIDAEAFCPWPEPPARTIDVMNIGRRSPVTHRALMDRPDLFCHFDTTVMSAVRDPHEHRAQFRAFAQRSRYFIVNRAKFTRDHFDTAPAELGLRFFEGAAAGAVLIGDHPKTPTFEEHFGWQDSVIHQPVDAPHIADVIDDLDSQPARLDAIRRRNVSQCLRHHDWAHRIVHIFRAAGLPLPPRLEQRLDELDGMANLVAG